VALWITVLSWHTVFTKRVIYYKFTFVWYSAKQGTTHRPTSHLAHCALSLPMERTRQCSWVRWPVSVMATSAEACFCCCTSSKQSSTTLLASAPNSKAVSANRISQWLPPQVYFFPWPWLWDPQWSVFFTLCMTGQSCRNIIPLKIRTSYTVRAKQI